MSPDLLKRVKDFRDSTLRRIQELESKGSLSMSENYELDACRGDYKRAKAEIEKNNKRGENE